MKDDDQQRILSKGLLPPDEAIPRAWQEFKRTRDYADLMGVIAAADFHGHEDIRDELIKELAERLEVSGARQRERVENYWMPKLYDQFFDPEKPNKEAAYRKIADVLGLTKDVVKKRIQRSKKA